MLLNYYEKIRPFIEKVNFLTLLLLVFLMPIYTWILPAISLFWLFTWILEGNFKKRFIDFNNKKFLLFSSLLFLFFLLSMLYSENADAAYKDSETKLTIFVFPFILWGSNHLYRKNLHLIIRIFLIGAFVSCLICLGNAVYQSFYWTNGNLIFNPINRIDKWSNYFFYDNLSLFLHPTYLSAYLAFAICIVINKLKNNTTTKIKLMLILLGVFFFLFIFLLSSRAGILISVVVLIGNVIILFQRKLLIFIIISVISAIFLFASSYFFKHNRIINSLKIITHLENQSQLKDTEIRLQIWYYSMDIVKNNFWFGVGVGDHKDELLKVYEKYKLEKAIKEHFNVHNQYIETLIQIGIFGLLILIGWLGYSIQIAWSKKHWLFFFFSIIFILNFMFESMLNSLAGVIFFSFFYSFFIILEPAIEKKQVNNNFDN